MKMTRKELTTMYITYCSGRKNEEVEELPSIERYQSGRIDEVYKLHGDDMMILSGVYGLLHTTTKIPYYDHLLQWNEIGMLKEIVMKQLEEYNVGKIVFYKKWLSQLQYQAIMMMVTSELKMKFEIIDLTPKEE